MNNRLFMHFRFLDIRSVMAITFVSALIFLSNTIIWSEQSYPPLVRDGEIIENGEELLANISRQSSIYTAAFSPDGKIIASGGSDGTIHLWDVTEGREIKEIIGHTGITVWAVSFSPDGQTIASCGSDGTIRLWDATTAKEIQKMGGHTTWVSSVAFSPDGGTIASGSWDGSIRLWDVSSGKEKRKMIRHT